MAYSSSKLHVLITLLLASLFLAMNIIAASARKLDIKSSTDDHHLTVRKLGGEELEGPTPTSCWDALLELQSCSGEVVLFFMNGEARLGANCCNAISTITQQCWPSMLGSIGITTEESNILRGYCDAIAHGDGGSGSGSGSASTNYSSPPPKST